MVSLKVSSSPHITGKFTTKRIMLDVIIALTPAALAGVFFFGFYSLLVVAVCMGVCVITEFTYNYLQKKPQTVGDLSAAVTGMLLGLNMPPLVPIYVPIIGSIFAIVIVKMLFGGIGKNFSNPAITARIFLILSFRTLMTSFISPVDYSYGFFNMFFSFDGVASATPLSSGNASLLYMFLGNVGGCIGETSAVALLVGGIYLSIRKVIDFRMPLVIIAVVALMSLVFSGNFNSMLYSVLGGGLLLGAIFMATDYSTSPNTTLGMIIYALVIGLITALLREYSPMPEGISFAILFGNFIVPLIDKYIYPKKFGEEKRNG